MSDWSEVLKPTVFNVDQRKKILEGREKSYEGKLKLLKIFNRIPDSIWEVRHTEKVDMAERTQHVISNEHRNDTLKAFDNSTRNQNIRWKGAISIFPRDILDKLLDFYTVEGDVFLDPFAGHNSRMSPSYNKYRHYIGYDISHDFMEFNRELAKKLLRDNPKGTSIVLKEQDSRTIDEPDNSADFIFSSPPYWNLEWYGDEKEQLGKLSYNDFMRDITIIYQQCYRVLKPGKFCIINVNDFRKGGKYYSYHVDTVNALKSVGFEQFDHLIMKYPNAMRKSFPNQILEEKLLPKIHEHLLVFIKPDPSCPGTFPWLKGKKIEDDETL